MSWTSGAGRGSGGLAERLLRRPLIVGIRLTGTGRVGQSRRGDWDSEVEEERLLELDL